jgi:hypothetical protein
LLQWVISHNTYRIVIVARGVLPIIITVVVVLVLVVVVVGGAIARNYYFT